MALAEISLTLEGADRRRTVMGRAAVVLGLLVYAALLATAWWAVVHLVPDQISLQAFGKT